MGLFDGFDHFNDVISLHSTMGMTERSDDQPTTLELTVAMTAASISAPGQQNNSKPFLTR
jgi:hypothetical protein